MSVAVTSSGFRRPLQRARGPAQVCYYTRQAASALAYLESHAVVHGDIKPANLFLSGAMHVKVGDFGMACRAGVRKGTSGTPNYMAPELLDGKEVRAPDARDRPRPLIWVP